MGLNDAIRDTGCNCDACLDLAVLARLIHTFAYVACFFFFFTRNKVVSEVLRFLYFLLETNEIMFLCCYGIRLMTTIIVPQLSGLSVVIGWPIRGGLIIRFNFFWEDDERRPVIYLVAIGKQRKAFTATRWSDLCSDTLLRLCNNCLSICLPSMFYCFF